MLSVIAAVSCEVQEWVRMGLEQESPGYLEGDERL